MILKNISSKTLTFSIAGEAYMAAPNELVNIDEKYLHVIVKRGYPLVEVDDAEFPAKPEVPPASKPKRKVSKKKAES